MGYISNMFILYRYVLLYLAQQSNKAFKETEKYKKS